MVYYNYCYLGMDILLPIEIHTLKSVAVSLNFGRSVNRGYLLYRDYFIR